MIWGGESGRISDSKGREDREHSLSGNLSFRAAIDAQSEGDTADRPIPEDQGLNGWLLGHFADGGHAPRPSPRAAPSRERFYPRKWCPLSDRRHYRVPLSYGTYLSPPLSGQAVV